ncbi:ABC transporter ATP-binding protein [Halococcus saccharolyticus]|uniref:ABC transporter ATP-binding protein n=1 Tax=Halococcus saccharolyticus DSM 5350 TaxID=1227455 RepID=M0MHK2_9EURY|nr:ABC transporter ATP-binding protein [Halococcus saccharolyticus]EMA43900.1 ABC transporter ATP-binding protein [Halococcus saccharolyticus DSM 5350]
MLAIDGLTKSYGAFDLGPIDLAVDEEVLAVLGPSGCGKTTLLAAIAGVTDTDAGTITLNGRDLTDRAPEDRGTVLVFQDGALFPHMTARENVAYAAASTGKIDELAATLEIGDVLDQRAATLSGGERQRVALARSLAADPSALLLDEPLANLDAPIKRRLRDELRPLLSSLSIPVVYVTHDQHEATAIGDRLAVVNDGVIQQLDTPSEVFARPATPFVASFTGSTNLFQARVAEEEGNPVLEWADHRFDVADDEYPVGVDIWFCIRPEYVTVVDDLAVEGRNNLDGHVRRRVFEGDGYRIDVTPEGADDVLQVTLSPPDYDWLDLDDRDRVRLSLPQDAIHIVGECDRTDAD